LFHYTSAESFLGILDSDSLWASQLRYLNDAAELVYANELIADVLSARLKRCSKNMQNVLQSVGEILPQVEYESYLYAASFSEDGDLLSQWRAYGDAGGGYAVGVRIRDVHPTALSPLVRKVEYDEAAQRAIVEGMVCRLPSDVETPDTVTLGLAGRELMADLALAGVFFKHGSFHEEKEWRALTIAMKTDRSILFRAAGGIIVPFVPVSLRTQLGSNPGRIPLGRVVCGPTLQATLSRRAVSLALNLHGHESCEVQASRVPLRHRLA